MRKLNLLRMRHPTAQMKREARSTARNAVRGSLSGLNLNGRPEWTRTIDLFRVKEAL